MLSFSDFEDFLDRRATDPDAPPLVLHFDGACWPNDRSADCLATWGWCLVGLDGGRSEADSGVAASGPGATNNVAEYHALGHCLRWLADRAGVYLTPGRPVVVRGDSQLVVKQVNGDWACNAEPLLSLRDRCRELLALLCGRGHSVLLEWVSREKNKIADGLSVEVWEAKKGMPFPDLRRMAESR